MHDASRRLARWRLLLLEFDVTIRYKKGIKNTIADAISRLPTFGSSTVDPNIDVPCFLLETSPKTPQLEGGGVDLLENDIGLSGLLNPPNLETQVFKSTKQAVIDAISIRNEDEWLEEEELDDEDTSDSITARCTEVLNVDTNNLQPLTIEELTKAQYEDLECQAIRKKMSHGDHTQFTEDERGLIIRVAPIDLSQQIYAPKILRSRILLLAHYPRLAGHPGGTRMYQTLRRTFYWPSMALDVFNTVRQCAPCTKERLSLRKHSRFLKLFPAMRPLEFVSIDILGPLTKSKRGNKYLVVMTDRYSKFVQTVPLRNITAWTLAKAFCDHWVFVFGPPKYILSDNGGQFISKFFQSVCNILGTRNLFTTAYHPQTNGQVERYNRTILAGLRHYCAEHAKDWDQFSSAITFGYNNTIHRATSLTPSQLVLTVPPGILILPHAEVIDHEDLSPRDKKRRFHERLRNLMNTATVKLGVNQQRYKRDFDKLDKQRDTDLKPGEFVFLRRETPTGEEEDSNLRILREHKLRSKATGPYKIEKVASHTITINQDGLIITVSRDRIIRAPDPIPSYDDTIDDNTSERQDVEYTNNVGRNENDAEAVPAIPAAEEQSDNNNSSDPSANAQTPSPTVNSSPSINPELQDKLLTSPNTSPDNNMDTDSNQPVRRSRRLRSKQTNVATQATNSNEGNSKEWTFDRLEDHDPETNQYLVRWTNYGPEHDPCQPVCDVPYNAVRSLHKRNKWRILSYKPNYYMD